MVSSSESGTLTKPALFGRDILRYHRAEDLTGIVIYFMLVFSPWAFGTTQRWSIWVMRGCGYVLGLLLLAKLVIRLRKDYRPARWGGGREEEPKQSAERNPNLFAESRRFPKEVSCSRRARLNFLLAVLTVCLVLYCLVSALNARGSYNPVLGTFEYRDYLWWLPHSFDRSSTAEAFWSCLALACAFWAIVDWLPGKEPKETRSRSMVAGEPRGAPTDRSPLRLQRLLWVLSLSGGLLAFEAIVQRISNSPKLLFLVQPEILQTGQTHLGSYAYRSNGAQYFNLLWPVCAGFWWTRQRLGCGSQGRKSLAILACVAIMAAGPLLSGARGPALIDLGMLSLVAPALAWSLLRDKVFPRKNKRRLLSWLGCVLAGVLILGLGLGWRDLRPRLERFQEDLGTRQALYESARRIARDYPLFGTGPGTFERVFQIYRDSADAYWPAQLHNDWLETRITFGRLGSGLLALAMLVVCLGWFVPGGLRLDRGLTLLLWLSLAGCLVQARWDFPLQVYSILFLFLVWCAVLFCVSSG